MTAPLTYLKFYVIIYYKVKKERRKEVYYHG